MPDLRFDSFSITTLVLISSFATGNWLLHDCRVS